MSRYIEGSRFDDFPEKQFFDLHIHTEHSPDCDTKVSKILEIARRQGFGISITDHNEILGAMEALDQDKVPVIPGIEVTAKEDLDILCYFPTKENLLIFFERDILPKRKNNLLKSNELSGAEVISACKARGGVAAFAHPYRYIMRIHTAVSTLPLIKHYFPLFDAVEVVNGKSPQILNRKALAKAKQFRKPFIAGSDAHDLSDLMETFTLFDSIKPGDVIRAIKEGKTIVIGRSSKPFRKLIRSGKKIIIKRYNEATGKE